MLTLRTNPKSVTQAIFFFQNARTRFVAWLITKNILPGSNSFERAVNNFSSLYMIKLIGLIGWIIKSFHIIWRILSYTLVVLRPGLQENAKFLSITSTDSTSVEFSELWWWVKMKASGVILCLQYCDLCKGGYDALHFSICSQTQRWVSASRYSTWNKKVEITSLVCY